MHIRLHIPYTLLGWGVTVYVGVNFGDENFLEGGENVKLGKN